MEKFLIFFFLISIFLQFSSCDDFVIESKTLPDFADYPTLSNGHIGFVVTDSSILLNGLYNGERGQSHRARIPNPGNVKIEFPCTESTCSYKLDMRQGFFEILMNGVGFNITQQIYAHRYYNRAMITKVVVEKTDSTVMNVPWTLDSGDTPGVDLVYTDHITVPHNGHDILTRCFLTAEREDVKYQPQQSKVCLALRVPQQFEFKSSLVFYNVMAIGRSRDEVINEVKAVLDEIDGPNQLLEKHANAWKKHWGTFEISVDDSNLNKIIHSSMFFLISNLPSEETNQPNFDFYGLSPSGIGKGGILYREYQGHSFWDTEMWMHPTILYLNPKWSEDLLKYRYNVRQAAKDNANNTGYAGYRFPWESAFTGREVTPDCCPEVVEYQHHVISDIAYAFRSHLAATHDVEWFKNIGCDIAWNTAKFWESRVKFNESTKLYDIRGVMGPDEDHHDIDNNVYTNVNAAINLYFGEFAGCVCKDVLKVSEADYENFVEIAKNIKLLYDKEKDVHPQYEGFEDGTMIKQADVVLLGFPLQLPMPDSTKRNNLLKYANLTRENGPAMTWAMHTIGYLDLQDEEEAKKNFQRSYNLYTREPFKVWSEVIPGVEGAGNFITGAGGFLQSIINGYGGIRLHFDYMEIKNFHVPPDSSVLEFKGISYLGSRFSLKITKDKATIEFKVLNSQKPLEVKKNSSDNFGSPSLGNVIELTKDESLIIRITEAQGKLDFGECKMRETVLGSAGTLRSAGIVVLLFISIIIKFFN